MISGRENWPRQKDNPYDPTKDRKRKTSWRGNTTGSNDDEEGRFYNYDDPQYEELYDDYEKSLLELDEYGVDYLENNPNDPLKTPIPKRECALICNKLECSRGLPFSLI